MDQNLIPKVTVLLPVYNGAEFLKEAIQSILNQTFKDFEFLIIDDASTDESSKIILSFQDNRIIFIQNDENLGLIATLNKGIFSSRGKYIARMDQDDIAYNTRIENQINFLEKNEDYGIVGTNFKIINSNVIKKYPLEHEGIKFSMLFYSPFLHPSVLIRKSIIIENNLKFDDEFQYAEDYQFWTQLVFLCKLKNIDQVLMEYRIHDNQISSKYTQKQIKINFKIQKEYLLKAGFIFSDEEVIILSQLNNTQLNNLNFDVSKMNLINSLLTQNKILFFFDESILNVFLMKIFKNLVLDCKFLKKSEWNKIKNNKLYDQINWTVRQRLNIHFKRLKIIFNK